MDTSMGTQALSPLYVPLVAVPCYTDFASEPASRSSAPLPLGTIPSGKSRVRFFVYPNNGDITSVALCVSFTVHVVGCGSGFILPHLTSLAPTTALSLRPNHGGLTRVC
jgi:hypothetical protein